MYAAGHAWVRRGRAQKNKAAQGGTDAERIEVPKAKAINSTFRAAQNKHTSFERWFYTTYIWHQIIVYHIYYHVIDKMHWSAVRNEENPWSR